jgi:hypothetical protein
MLPFKLLAAPSHFGFPMTHGITQLTLFPFLRSLIADMACKPSALLLSCSVLSLSPVVMSLLRPF